MDIDKIIDKVNDLMALASDPAASDNEASLAYERAQRLIDRYRLEDWRRDRTRRVMTERSVPLAARGWNTFQLELAGIVARANGCRVYGSYDYSAATGRREHRRHAVPGHRARLPDPYPPHMVRPP